MSFQEVASLDADTTVSLGGTNKKTGKANPKSAEGYFLGTRMVASPKAKTGEAAIHFLQTPKGNLGVWGKTDMDRKLKTVKPGAMIRISFDKMVSVPGKNDMYRFKVEVDSSNTIEVAGFGDGSDTNADTEGYTTDEAGDAGDSGTYGGDDEADANKAAIAEIEAEERAAAERKARVQALLKKPAPTAKAR